MLDMKKEIPGTQAEQLTWLYEITGIKWTLSSEAYVDYCATNERNEVMFVVLPVGNMGHYSVYTPEGYYCTYSIEFIAQMKKLLSKYPDHAGLAFKYDLNNLPELVLTDIVYGRLLQATFSLDGDIICSPIDNRLPIAVGFNSHALSVNASGDLLRFIQTMKLKLAFDGYEPTNVGLGYSMADKEHKIWNTSITVYPNLDFDAAANPQPIKTQFASWELEGQLGFKVSGRWIDKPPNSLAEPVEDTSSIWEQAQAYSMEAAGVVSAAVILVVRNHPKVRLAKYAYQSGVAGLTTLGLVSN